MQKVSKVQAEYIWLDGLDEKKGKRTQELRSKTRIGMAPALIPISALVGCVSQAV